MNRKSPAEKRASLEARKEGLERELAAFRKEREEVIIAATLMRQVQEVKTERLRKVLRNRGVAAY